MKLVFFFLDQRKIYCRAEQGEQVARKYRDHVTFLKKWKNKAMKIMTPAARMSLSMSSEFPSKSLILPALSPFRKGLKSLASRSV